mgnify:FL=1|jgi:hypothetical protein
MIESTAKATHALELIEEGLQYLRWGPPSEGRNLEVAQSLLDTLGSLTVEYGPEFFTDDEIKLISNTTVAALRTVIAHITQENYE